jgi:hypothetical protein
LRTLLLTAAILLGKILKLILWKSNNLLCWLTRIEWSGFGESNGGVCSCS